MAAWQLYRLTLPSYMSIITLRKKQLIFQVAGILQPFFIQGVSSLAGVTRSLLLSNHQFMQANASADLSHMHLVNAKYLSSSVAVYTAKKQNQERSANSRLDERCQVFDRDDLLVGHMTVREAEQMAQTEDMKLLDLGRNADNLRSFKLMSGKELAQENKRQKMEKKTEQAKVKEKELRVTTKISDHDLDIKVKQARDILTKGGLVKFIIKSHKQNAEEESEKHINHLLKKITSQLKDCSAVKHGTKNAHEQQLLLRPLQGKESDSSAHASQ